MLNKIIGFEKKEWARLHKLHIGASIFTLSALFVIGVVVITSSARHADAATGVYKTAVHPEGSTSSQSLVSNQPVSIGTSSTTPPVSTPAKPTKTNVDSVPKVSSTNVSNASSTGSSINAVPQNPTNTVVADTSVLKTTIPDHGGYPDKWANPSLDTITDDFGYPNREGTSYVAWKAHYTFPEILVNKLSNLGNAKDWPITVSFPTGTTPEVNSAFSIPSFGSGEVYWVESVGTSTFTASVYNYDSAGSYKIFTFPNTKTGTFIYFK